MTHITITGRSESDTGIAEVLRGYVDRFELTSSMVKKMMLDAAAEIERRKAQQSQDDPQAMMDYRYTPDEIGELNVVIDELRAEIKRLQAENAELRARIDEGLPTADDVRGIMREPKL